MNNDNVPFVPQQPIPEQPPKQGGMSYLTYIVVNVIISLIAAPVLFFSGLALIGIHLGMEMGTMGTIDAVVAFVCSVLPFILFAYLYVLVYRLYKQKLTVDGKLTKKARSNIITWIFLFIIEIVGLLIIFK